MRTGGRTTQSVCQHMLLLDGCKFHLPAEQDGTHASVVLDLLWWLIVLSGGVRETRKTDYGRAVVCRNRVSKCKLFTRRDLMI